MKKVLLFIVVLLLAGMQLAAQPVPVWTEDFNGGSTGWTVRSTLCGNITGPAIGRWTLTSATLNGTAIPDLQGEFAVNTSVDYSVRFSDGANQAEAQARYTLAGDVWTSNLNGVAIPLDSTIYNYNAANRQTLYFTNLDMEQDAYSQWGATFLGLNSPTFTVAGDTLTIASADNTVELQFNKASACGALWSWSPNGSVRSGFFFPAGFGELNITSPTAANGAMVLNADFLTTRGLQANVPSGPPPYPQHTSELISPVIDLSGVTANVSLSFYELVRFLNPSADAPPGNLRTSVSYSTDGGVTWSAAENVNVGVEPNANPLQVQRIVNLPGVQGSANFRIKFIWSADFYYWAIDDVSIIEQPRYDMRVNPFYAFAPNAATPISQLEPFGFIADIENVGSQTVTASTLTVTIQNSSNEVIYADSIHYGSIAPDSLAENVFFPDEYTPPATAGTYTGRYTLTIDDVPDEIPLNNSQEFSFVMTDSIFSKELGIGLLNYTIPSNNSYSWGNIYYIPNGEGFAANSVTFSVGNAAALTGRNVTVLLYQWDGDTNGDDRINPAEYADAPIAFNSYEFTGMEGTNLINIPVDIDGNQVPLESNKHYFIALQYATEDNVTMQTRGTNRLNYLATFFYADSLMKPRYGSALSPGNTPNYDLVFTVMPVVRLNIGPIVSVNETPLPEAAFEVFPNPASDMVNLKLALDSPQDIQIALYDQNGRVLTLRRFDQVNREIINMPVHNLPSGTYYLKVNTPSGAAVRPVIVKH